MLKPLFVSLVSILLVAACTQEGKSGPAPASSAPVSAEVEPEQSGPNKAQAQDKENKASKPEKLQASAERMVEYLELTPEQEAELFALAGTGTRKEMLAVLTPAQQQQWAQLKAERKEARTQRAAQREQEKSEAAAPQ